MSKESYRLMQERDRRNLPRPLISAADALEMVFAAIEPGAGTINSLWLPLDNVTVKDVWETLDTYRIGQWLYDYEYSISASIYTGEIMQIHQSGIGKTAKGRGRVNTTTRFPTPLLDAFNTELQAKTDKASHD